MLGSGIAGCLIGGMRRSRSWRASRRAGAHLPKSSEEYRWTESYLRMKSEHEVSDDFEELLVANAGHHIDRT